MNSHYIHIYHNTSISYIIILSGYSIYIRDDYMSVCFTTPDPADLSAANIFWGDLTNCPKWVVQTHSSVGKPWQEFTGTVCIPDPLFSRTVPQSASNNLKHAQRSGSHHDTFFTMRSVLFFSVKFGHFFFAVMIPVVLALSSYIKLISRIKSHVFPAESRNCWGFQEIVDYPIPHSFVKHPPWFRNV